ncbi:MAG: DUF4091 domain-containing protein [Clostridia bacterium]|nr:DUF4091 domain-containing protein [Clostridia bacterium]
MLETRICDSLHKIFSDDAVFPPERDELRLFSGEKGSLQLCLRSDRELELSVDCSGALPCRLYAVREVFVSLPAYEGVKRSTLLRKEPGLFPDLLEPYSAPLRVSAGRAYALWVGVDTSDAPAGTYDMLLTVSDGSETVEKPFTVKVSPVQLRKQTLIHTDWFHSDCLSTYYDAPVFGEKYWRIVSAYMKNAGRHGVNCILTPLFTPPLDTEVGSERPTVQLVGVKKTENGWGFDFSMLEKWISLALDAGIDHFEFSHFFTQWGAVAAPKVLAETPEGLRRVFGWETDSLSPEYHGFLRSLASALTDFTDKKGITPRCFVHCSDEPGGEHIRRYKKCAALVHDAFGAYRHIDALSDPVYYEQGIVPLPVPAENHIEPFVGRVPSLWTYYCCGQLENEMPNRFVAIPSIRCRILGTLLYKYRCEGFLHWGYNFWYSSLSRKQIDPFADVCSDGAFPGGDAFCVYPGADGEPLSSLRQKVFYDGLQDMRALQTVEEKLGRAVAERIISDNLGEIDFAHYPMDAETFLRFRDALFDAASEISR